MAHGDAELQSQAREVPSWHLCDAESSDRLAPCWYWSSPGSYMCSAMNPPANAVPGPAAGTPTMKAVVRRCYGPPDVLAIEDIEKPLPTDGRVLVKVRAASVNPVDWHFMRATPYLIRIESGFGAPKNPRIGTDFAGTIEAVGKGVTRFKPGDEVFGGGNGALAQYVTIAEDGNLALKPAGISFEQAAAVNVAGLTALQTLRDRAGLEPGQKVLINGASGGVGTFAVQIAKSLGAEVTGVCSTRNVELVRSLGADHVIDYTQRRLHPEWPAIRRRHGQCRQPWRAGGAAAC